MYIYLFFNSNFLIRFLSSVKALNGSNFVHARLLYQRNTFEKLEDNIKRATQRIIQHTGLSMEGNEIYVRSNALNATKGKGIYEKSFV